MGSAVPRPAGFEFGRALLTEMEEFCRQSIADTGEIDYQGLLALADSRLQGRHRDDMRLFVVAYLGKCLTGTMPKHRSWDPFL